MANQGEVSVDDNHAIAARLREELARRRISRQALADMAKISLSTLEKALTGSRPFSLATVVRIEDVLGARLREQASAYIDHARAEPELFRVMFLFPPQLPDSNVPTESALPAATTAFALAHSAVVTAVRAGAIDCEDSLLTTFTLWAGIHGVATVLQLGFSLPPESEEQLRDEMIDRLLAGYGVR